MHIIQPTHTLTFRSQLEASGLAIFNAVAYPETELFGEKIIRVELQQFSSSRLRRDDNDTKLREKFKRGDALLITPLTSFRGKEIDPREGLVIDVGSDYLTLGVGSAWPKGLLEMRKHYQGYTIRLDRSLSNVPLKAQRVALEKLRKGQAGSVANLLVHLYYNNDAAALKKVQEVPIHFDSDGLEEQIAWAIKDAMSYTTFKPNASQEEAIIWALKRKVAMIRGPPGTGKTRAASLLISTALNMKIKTLNDNIEDDDIIERDEDDTRSPRVLAVCHSNGAADVLVQVLLEMNVSAVRAGRPASVSSSIQHRTIAALSERLPEVVALRQKAGDVSLDSHTRSSAIYDAQKYMNEAQTMIAKSAQVVVASCIGAQQLMATIGMQDDEIPFDIVVLDEAAQTTEPALISALQAAKAHQLILVGDTKQLPPTVTTQDVELRKTIGISPMERLLNNGMAEFVLKEQYRMPQSLLLHPNSYFYKGVVKCATTSDKSGLTPPLGFPWPSTDPLCFLETGKDSEVTHNFGGRSNPTEVEIIVAIINKVIAAGDIKAVNIAIITPYNKQVQLFRENLNSNGGEMSDVKVGTVDSYQGQETDLVLFSAVRSNLLKELGFLRDARRLNVAITRAKRGLIVVGDPTVLRTCPHWTALLESCSNRGCTLTQDEYFNHVRAAATIASPDEERERRLSSLDFGDDELLGLFSD